MKEEQKLNFNPETEICSELWKDMSVNDLWLQKMLITQRISICKSYAKPEMYLQMEKGLKFLDAILEEKINKDRSVADSVVMRY